MGTHVCLPIQLILLRAKRAFPLAHSWSPLTNPPGPHAAFPGSLFHPRACYLAHCPSVSLPITSWCLPSYACPLKKESRIQLCPQYPAQNHKAGAWKHPQTEKTPWVFSSLSHSLSTWKMVPHVLGLLCCDTDHRTCPSLPGLQGFQEVLVLDAHVDSVHMTVWC